MATAKIGVVTSNRSIQRHVTRALASAGHEVTPWGVTDVEDILQQPHDMFVVDADEEGAHIKTLLQRLRQARSESPTLLLSHDPENKVIVDLLSNERLNHLIARHGGVTTAQELVDENELIVTCHKLMSGDIFGIEKYLPTWGIQLNHHCLKSTKHKADAMHELEQFLTRIDCYGAIVPAISLVADELLMNAIFNAPRDRQGKPKYVDIDRGAEFSLDSDEYVDFRFACDGRYVALSVQDKFGTLDRDVIVRYLEQSFMGKQASIEKKRMGAGLGLYMVFNSITQLTFNIHAQKKTEVIALFYVRSGARAFKSSGRSLNIFLLQ